MHLSRSNIPNRNIHIHQNPIKRIDFFLKKISRGPTYSEQKVVDKRLGNFVVIFIYLKERKGGGGTVVRNFIHYIITFFQISLFMSIYKI